MFEKFGYYRNHPIVQEKSDFKRKNGEKIIGMSNETWNHPGLPTCTMIQDYYILRIVQLWAYRVGVGDKGCNTNLWANDIKQIYSCIKSFDSLSQGGEDK